MRKSQVLDITGQTFGRLTVISFAGLLKKKNALWNCVCSCGRTHVALGTFLRFGLVKSCGCFRTEKLIERLTTHGLRRSPVYNVWLGMKQRCLNQRSPAFHNYGERGIRVCDRWKESFELFAADMGDRPNGFTLERINNGGDYEPSNCKWASRKEQNSNTRRNCKITINGETLMASEWCRRFGISQSVVIKRLKSGWKKSRALFEKLHKP